MMNSSYLYLNVCDKTSVLIIRTCRTTLSIVAMGCGLSSARMELNAQLLQSQFQSIDQHFAVVEALINKNQAQFIHELDDMSSKVNSAIQTISEELHHVQHEGCCQIDASKLRSILNEERIRFSCDTASIRDSIINEIRSLSLKENSYQTPGDAATLTLQKRAELAEVKLRIVRDQVRRVTALSVHNKR
uniref:Uncharacterized protein n=1 Tax=Spongospora subterranea TaxID=70186 RepID=A0A0H5QX20_9EUKA|eukprot:CRZ06485.1 hypothetical protein [Spongospora subterranea]